MSPLLGLFIAWGILTAILVLLLIYKSTLTMHEDDSIFLNESESQMEKEQVEILKKMNKITPIVKVLGALSGAMILVMAGMFIYSGLMSQSTLQ
jgi:mannitol-specific phosphotransferase system IIBC component